MDVLRAVYTTFAIHSAGTRLLCTSLASLESRCFMDLVDCFDGAVYAPAPESCRCRYCMFVICLFLRHIVADSFDDNI